MILAIVVSLLANYLGAVGYMEPISPTINALLFFGGGVLSISAFIYLIVLIVGSGKKDS